MHCLYESTRNNRGFGISGVGYCELSIWYDFSISDATQAETEPARHEQVERDCDGQERGRSERKWREQELPPAQHDQINYSDE